MHLSNLPKLELLMALGENEVKMKSARRVYIDFIYFKCPITQAAVVCKDFFQLVAINQRAVVYPNPLYVQHKRAKPNKTTKCFLIIALNFLYNKHYVLSFVSITA